MCWRTHSKPYPSLWRRIQRKSEVGRNSSWNAKFSGCFLAVVGNTPLQCRLEFRDSASGSLRKLTSLRRVLTRKFKLTEPQIQEEQRGFYPCCGTVNQIFTSSRTNLFCRPGDGLGANYCPRPHSLHDACSIICPSVDRLGTTQNLPYAL